MQKNRVQCSLIFPDDDVFENLVLPLRDHRELSNFLVTLVEKYYSSKEMQEIVNSETIEAVNERREAYDEVYQSLAAMDYLISEGKNVVADGRDVFDEIASNAEAAGVFVRNEDDTLGKGVSRVNPDVLSKLALIESKDGSATVVEKEETEDVSADSIEEQGATRTEEGVAASNRDVQALQEQVRSLQESVMQMQSMILAQNNSIMQGQTSQPQSAQWSTQVANSPKTIQSSSTSGQGLEIEGRQDTVESKPITDVDAHIVVEEPKAAIDEILEETPTIVPLPPVMDNVDDSIEETSEDTESSEQSLLELIGSLDI